MSIDLSRIPEPTPRPALAPMNIDPAPEPSRKKNRRTPRQQPAAPQPQPSTSTGSAIRETSLSLPATLVEALRDEARNQGISVPAVILDAITHAHPDLHRLVENEQCRRTPQPDPGGLFPHAFKPSATPPPAQAVINIRLTEANLGVIDQLVLDTKAASRSKLVGLALRHYLSKVE